MFCYCRFRNIQPGWQSLQLCGCYTRADRCTENTGGVSRACQAPQACDTVYVGVALMRHPCSCEDFGRNAETMAPRLVDVSWESGGRRRPEYVIKCFASGTSSSRSAVLCPFNEHLNQKCHSEQASVLSVRSLTSSFATTINVEYGVHLLSHRSQARE